MSHPEPRPGVTSPATPVGVRDLTPAAAAAFIHKERLLLDTLRARGYAPVITPAFELAHVFERGLGAPGAAVLRFVDPQNGDVLALRSDITPQIARLVAGPMAGVPAPLRLCYAGRVFRLREHREFQHREVAQAGAELLGLGGPDADLEVLELCLHALRAAGVSPVFSLGHSQLVPAALPASCRDPEALLAAVRRKDAAEVQALAGDGPLRHLVRLAGPAQDVLPEAARLAAFYPSLAPPLLELRSLVERMSTQPAEALLDLAAVGGFGYYTGFVFHAFAAGAGAPVASGGRYDSLIGRYGRDLCAAGFAIDGEGLAEAEGATCLASS